MQLFDAVCLYVCLSVCLSVCPITTSGATTFSKLGVQFLGLRYYCPSPEKGIPSLA